MAKKNKSSVKEPTGEKQSQSIINIVSSSDCQGDDISGHNGDMSKELVPRSPIQHQHQLGGPGGLSPVRLYNGKRFVYIGRDATDLNIKLRSVSDIRDPGIGFVLKPWTSLRMPWITYGKRIDVTPDKIQLLKNGLRINPHDSADKIGLVDGDELIVEGVDPFMNTDARFKMLTINSTERDNPVSMDILASVTMTVEEMYQAWATFDDCQVEDICLVFDKKDVHRSQRSIIEAKLKNCGELWVRSAKSESSSQLPSSQY